MESIVGRTACLALLLTALFLISGCAPRLVDQPGSPEGVSNTTRFGVLSSDETWSGEILVTEQVVVPEGVTLNIEPGTVVKFRHYRGYKEPGRRIGLSVEGGILRALGTPERQIWFTSDAVEPVNGDWSGIMLGNTATSALDYVIVEFGEMGVEQFDSSVAVTNSIVRWSNAEGLYAERSKPVFVNNTLYENGYHEIALEQYNEDVQIRNNLFRNGEGLHWAIHHEKTSSLIEGNSFSGYSEMVITAGMDSNIAVKNNIFRNLTGSAAENPIVAYDGSTAEIGPNDFENDSISMEAPVLGYEDTRGYELGYVPGDREDRYLYIYPDDETRRTVRRIGRGLGFGWSLLYANGSLWRFSIGNGIIGKGQDLIRIDPGTEEIVRYGTDEVMNPRGLAHDGEFFYVNDFSLLKIFKFKIEGDYIKVYDSFDIPHRDLGGTMGLTSDGMFLYLLSRDGSALYKMDTAGVLVEEIPFENTGVGNALVWTGDHFWTTGGCTKGLCKWTKKGRLTGEIYPPAKDTWALAYDGTYLWSIQRTSETWDDPKIYQIEILDDSLG